MKTTDYQPTAADEHEFKLWFSDFSAAQAADGATADREAEREWFMEQKKQERAA